MVELPLIAQTLDHTCGAACFESMFRVLRHESRGELFFAEELGTLELGYTPPENVVKLAKKYQFQCNSVTDGTLDDLQSALARDEVVFVTWWDEDAGHYSLVQSIDLTSIELMDPWLAREGRTNRMQLVDFLQYWRMRGSRIISVRA